LGIFVIHFDHIAIALPRIADAPPALVGVLGGVPDRGAPSGPYRWATWRFAGGGCIEILEPLGEDGFLHRFLARHGPGIHHATFKVPSLREACARARAEGYGIVGYDDSDPYWAEAFLHPKQALGIVVQLVEQKSRGGEESRWRFPGPPGPDNPPPPVTILGLRLRAPSRARAGAQWGRVLGGEGAEGADGGLIYRWPGSPMRLAVEIDAAGEEGPIAIEFASDRPVSFPQGVHVALSALFVQR
jgi:catechol 2,3-dioxygenase-like lactoylglutathione lyase family enzyme